MRVIKLITATGAILALTACAPSSPSGNSEITASGKIRAVVGADPSTFAPANGVSADDEIPARLLFDTLIRRDANGGFVGGLATEWESNAMEAQFTIRDGATCADGTVITPTVVADSLTQFASPETSSSYKGAVFGPGIPTVTADDSAGTVSVSLSEPWSDLLNGLTLSFTGVVCPAGLEDPEGLAAGSVEGAFSGPYTLTKADHGLNYDFQLREDYDAWPEFETPLTGTPAAEIGFTVVSDPSTVANQLSTGGLDYAIIKNRDIERFADSSDFSVTQIPFAAHYVLFNGREGSVFNDIGMRKIASQLIDREAFIQASTAGLGETFPSFVNPALECAVTTEDYLVDSDPVAASSALDGVKIRFVGTQLVGPNGAGNTYLHEALRAAGAEVELNNLDNSSWATAITKETDTWDMTVMVDLNVIGTVGAALGKVTGEWVENGGRSFTGSSNDLAVSEMKQAMIADTVESKCAHYEAAQQAVLESFDVFPLGSGAAAAVTIDNVSVRTFNGVVDPATLRVEN